MKTVVAIIVLTLAVVGFSYGQTTSGSEQSVGASETSGTAPTGAVEVRGGQASIEAGTRGTARATPGQAPSTEPSQAAAGSIIRLLDPVTGASYGPVLVRQGAKVKIGDKTYTVVIEKVETPVPESEPEKTEAQVLLEEKLRRTIVPELAFQDAGLCEIADYLSEHFDVNIVLTNDVRQASLAITTRLRNIPLFDALRYVAEVVCVTLRVDDHAVVFTFLGR
jgi:hypothetical protein